MARPLTILRLLPFLLASLVLSAAPVPAAPALLGKGATQGLLFSKTFTNDPAAAGGTVNLQFSITNLERDFDAAAVAFTDDLNATLAGLVATGLPMSNVCGAGSTLSGSGLLSLSGGHLALDGGACTFNVTLQVPAGAAPGAYTNTTSAITASYDGSPYVGPTAQDDLAVSDAPLLSKEFLTNPVAGGGSTVLRFTLVNTSPSAAATGISFTDDLDAFLPGIVVGAPPAAGSCGAGSTFGASPVGLTGGDLPAGGSCTFDYPLTIPAVAGGIYTNTTSDISGTVGGNPRTGPGASETLTVVAAPILTKEFADDPALPGGSVILQLTLTYPETAALPAAAINFTDDLNATLAGLQATGTPLANVCGAGSSLSGTSLLSFTGGSLEPGESCTFSATLAVPAGADPGTYPNTTSAVGATIGGATVAGAAAGDNLVLAGLGFGKSFVDDPVIAGDTVVLRFTLVNATSGQSATGIGFSDDLDAALGGLVAVGLPANDVCGAGSTLSGTSLITLTGGSLAPGASCTFDVTLQVPGAAADDSYLNTTSNLTATLGGSPVVIGPASDLLVVSSEVLQLSKAFTDDPVAPGGTVTLQFRLTNASLTRPVGGITFSDDLDAALSGLAAAGLPAANVCGAGSQISGTGLLTFTGGSLAAGASCTFDVTVQVPAGAGGVYTNVTSTASGTAGALPVSGAAASGDLIVTSLELTKTFSGPTVPGGTPTLTFFLRNLSASSLLSALTFTDDLDATLAGLIATGLPLVDPCGAGSSFSGSSNLVLANGALPPNGTCSFAVSLAVPGGALPGTYTNTTSNVLSGAAVAGLPASDDLVVVSPPGFTKTFAPSVISVGGTAVLSFVIDNSASPLAAANLAFVDNLPAGTILATPANATNSCGGSLSAAAGGAVVSLTGGSVPAGGSCSIAVSVLGTTAGNHLNTTGNLTSSAGNSGPASDTLHVLAPIGFTKVFQTSPVLPGGLVQLQYSISNPSPTESLSGMSFSDDLGAAIPGLQSVSAPAPDICGAGSSISGSGVVTFAGGSLAANASCTFAVTVKVPGSAPPGTVTSTSSNLIFSSPLTGSGLSAPPASADLTVAFLGFSKAFLPATANAGELVELRFTIVNPDPANPASGLAFTDDLDAVLGGLAAVGLPATGVCGAGSQLAGTSLLTLTGGSLAAGASCTFTVQVQVPADATGGGFLNTTSELSATVDGTAVAGGAASVAEATLTVTGVPLAIPTLQEWGMLLFAAALAGLALLRLRWR
jgi:hypothetical protein